MRPFFFYISSVQIEDFCHGTVRGTIWALKTDKGGSLMNEQIRYGPGAVPRRNAEGYQDPTAHMALLTIKKEDRVFRPLVYICSPYSGDVESNVARARDYCRFAVTEKNAIPFAPHLLLPQYMEDSDPQQRELAMFMNMVFLGKCNELWVFGQCRSEGMQQEIAKAKKRRMTIRYFTEEMQEVSE